MIIIHLYLRLTVFKLFNDYASFISETKYKTIHEKGIISMLALAAYLAKVSDHSNIKILSPKQMLQGLPIALGQVKAGNMSENLLNGIRQIVYSFYQAKEITKKVYSKVMNSIKLKNRMDIIFMN